MRVRQREGIAVNKPAETALQQVEPWDKGDAIVLQPDEGESFWQPMPANGYSTIKVGPRNCRSNHASFGVQVIAPGGYVREHWHDTHDEILFCFEGTGTFLVDGVAHKAVPGTTVFAGRWVKHKIINDGPGDFKMTWTYLPPGIHNFFEAIGKARKPGEAAPAPFARPENTLAAEKAAGFGPKIGE
jgi:quercetin dioxygenase-like cupin family protein